jgi:ABC-type transport system involved in cytochrome c biogenesis ATPase subunit
MQVIIVTALTTWGLVFTGNAARLWFAPSYILGVMILFGWASYLGAYVLSTFVQRAAFAVAAGVHVVLFVFYILAYALNQYVGSPTSRTRIYDRLQAGMGLTSPAANLGRALFITSNNYDLPCGETGYNVQNPFAYNLYGGVYFYLILQIVFLSGVLYLIEYGSMEWFHKLRSKKRVPAGTPYSVLEEGSPKPTMNEESSNSSTGEQKAIGDAVLVVSNVSKHFGKISAVENVSFNISADETLALLGANGAGKTTVVNMIRGLIKPNAGSIHLDGVSVIDNPQKARIHIGVCPQDDAIDELTVRQTLNFFAAIKGVKDVTANVEKIMDAFGIRGFEGFAVKKLSGGTRRKLMVAVALIGMLCGLIIFPLFFSVFFFWRA